MTKEYYELGPPKKRFPWGWTIGGLAMFGLLGTCSFAFVGMFQNMGVVKPINDEFIATVLSDQLPPVSEGFYSDKSGITDEAIAPVNRMIAALGPPDDIAATVCAANSYAGTGQLSGEFVSCSGTLTYPISAASLATRWRREGEDWKLLEFNLQVVDTEAYTNLLVEQKLQDRDATAE